MQIRVAEPIETRQCEFSLGLQGDSVFADFNLDENSLIYLARISFDGYGSCYPSWEREPLKIGPSESRLLLRAVRENSFENKDVGKVLKAYFIRCGDAIWDDALRRHELI